MKLAKKTINISDANPGDRVRFAMMSDGKVCGWSPSDNRLSSYPEIKDKTFEAILIKHGDEKSYFGLEKEVSGLGNIFNPNLLKEGGLSSKRGYASIISVFQKDEFGSNTTQVDLIETAKERKADPTFLFGCLLGAAALSSLPKLLSSATNQSNRELSSKGEETNV